MLVQPAKPSVPGLILLSGFALETWRFLDSGGNG